MTLAKRLEVSAIKRFNGDKLRAMRYLRKQATFYAEKADAHSGTKFHDQWRKVYKAYSSAVFSLDYHLALEEEAFMMELAMEATWDSAMLGSQES